MQVTTVGIALAKKLVQVYNVDAEGHAVFIKRLARNEEVRHRHGVRHLIHNNVFKALAKHLFHNCPPEVSLTSHRSMFLARSP